MEMTAVMPLRTSAQMCIRDRFYLFQGDGVRMTMAYVVLLRRKGYVDDFCLQLLLTNHGFHLCLGFFQNPFNLFTSLIDQLAYLRSVLRSHVLHTLQYIGQFTFFAENRHARDVYKRQAFRMPFSSVADSRVRQLVVPTQMTRDVYKRQAGNPRQIFWCGHLLFRVVSLREI